MGWLHADDVKCIVPFHRDTQQTNEDCHFFREKLSAIHLSQVTHERLTFVIPILE